MQRKANGPRPPGPRRTFLKSASALAAGLLVPEAPAVAATETLALFGGSPAVTFPGRPHAQAARWPIYGAEEEKAVLHVLRNPSYQPLGALEKDWKAYYRVPHVCAYCNGTSALAAMFFALNLPPGSEILVPSYTFFATIVPMRLFGLVPAFVDVNPRTLNLDVADARRRVTRNTRAVLPVHWLGLPADMDAISDLAREHGLIVLEDSAHAHGASLKGKLTGTWGQMAIFSYQMSKPVPALEGGMGMYQRQEDYERATTFGHYDLPEEFPTGSAYRKYFGTGLGLKLRMHPLAAALARCQLRTLEERTTAGAAQVRRLNDRLRDLTGLAPQYTRPDAKRIYYAANMLFLDEAKAGISRAALVKALQAEGVHAGASSYRLQHQCALYQEGKWWHHKPHIPDLPGSEEANRTAVALPYFTSEVPELVDQYVKAFEKVWAHRKQLVHL